MAWERATRVVDLTTAYSASGRQLPRVWWLLLRRHPAAMTLVNCCVVLRNRVLYPWRISASNIGSITIRGYYHSELEHQVRPTDGSRQRLSLSKGYLGKLKGELDLVDLDLDLGQAVAAFSYFVKYEVDDGAGGEGERVLDLSRPSAFSVLMSSQRAICQRKLPATIDRENKTKKDCLYNDIISSLEERELKWKSSEVDSAGVSFVRNLTECL